MTRSEYDSIVRIIEVLMPIMLEHSDEDIKKDFRVLLSYLAKEGDDRRHNQMKAAKARWEVDCNAEKYKEAIRTAKTKMAVGADREEILDAAMSKTGNGVKGPSRKNLARILRQNNALPSARRKH